MDISGSGAECKPAMHMLYCHVDSAHTQLETTARIRTLSHNKKECKIHRFDLLNYLFTYLIHFRTVSSDLLTVIFMCFYHREILIILFYYTH